MTPRTHTIFKLGETPRRAAILGAKLAAVLAIVAALGALGLWDVIDALLERQYYALRGARTSQQSVVLVGVDEETLARWGSPPYEWSQLTPLFAAIDIGRPVVTAIIEPGRRMVRDPTPTPEIAQAVFARRRLAPAPAGGSAAPEIGVGAGGVVDTVRLRGAAGPTLTAEILERSGLRSHDPAHIPVNYVGRTGLPLLSAARVATATIPSATFAGKIVLIGIVDRGVAGEVGTPIGGLTPAEVHAHAILGLTDGVAWRRTAGWARWVLLVLLALAVLALVPQIDETRALISVAAAALLLLFADYLLFARGVVRWGASAAVFTMLAATMVSRFFERRRLREALGDVAREIRLRSGLESLAGEPRGDDNGFWLRVAELARLYLDCRSSIVAELPPERWHLSLRVITGASLDQIQEKRRDVRRGPYRRAHLTLNPVWQDDFMSAKRGERTLLVPLVVSTRLLGFWILNFPVEVRLEPAQIKLVSGLARQVSLAVERRHAAAASGEDRSLAAIARRLLGDGRLGDELDAVGGDVKRLAHDKRGLASLIDALPFGVLVATLWGEIRYANAAMRRLAAEEGAERLHALSVADLVMLMTTLSKDEVHEGLRKLVRELPELHLSGRPDERGHRAKVQLALSWLAREEQRVDGDEGEQLILLCAVPTRLASRARARASDFQDEGTTQTRLAGDGLVPGEVGDSTNPTGPAMLSIPPARGFTESFERLPGGGEASGELTERVPMDELSGVVEALKQVDDTAAHVRLAPGGEPARGPAGGTGPGEVDV
jgi:hypothetical protein